MSAVVTAPNPNALASAPVVIDVPKANGYTIDEQGWLHLHTTRYGDQIAVFKQWHHVVITPDRGPDGKFTKRGS